MKSEAAAFFWFNSTVISDGGHSFYGALVYGHLLRELAPKNQKMDQVSFVLFDGDCMAQIGFGCGWYEYFCAADQPLLERIVQIEESSICYVVVILGNGNTDWGGLDRGLIKSVETGYIGMTRPRDFGRDELFNACEKMGLCLSIRIDAFRLKKINFALIPDAQLKELGFDPYLWDREAELAAQKAAQVKATVRPPQIPAPNLAGIPKRAIRVFVSSTFLDMQAERDQLVKFTFPQIRKLCESRGATCVEVDLRWGITPEEERDGKVLRLCLEEIHRCRPYFIGMLGERYGQVANDISAELMEDHSWLRECRDRSLTEIEITHGVLRDGQMKGHAFFYFRDRGFRDHLPSGALHDEFEESRASEQLHNLKQRIRKARDQEVCRLRENYRNPQELGEWVLEDFTRLIDELFPKDQTPDPLDQEAGGHEAFAVSRTGIYVGGENYFKRLNTHVTGPGQVLVVAGASGSGKSALLANWAASHCARQTQDFILAHYIGATPDSTDWAKMLRRVMAEFKRRLGLEQEIPEKSEALRESFTNWLNMAAVKGRVILIFDALNQLEDHEGAPDLVWLPLMIPDNVRIIVSTLPGRPLDEIKKRGWPLLEIEPLETPDRSQLISEYLSQYTKALDRASLDLVVNAPQSANPLFLRALLEELRIFGSHERLEQYIAYYLKAETTVELYQKVLDRWENDYSGDTDLVRKTMTLLWAARLGLAESELLDIVGEGGLPHPHARWTPLFLAAEHSLVNRSGLLSFFHEYLREAVKQRYLPDAEQERAAHLRIADYFANQPPSQRRTDELPWQLGEAQSWERLYQLLVERDFFKTAWQRNRFDVANYWLRVEGATNLRKLTAYRSQIEHPESEADKRFLWFLGFLFEMVGHTEESFRLRSALVESFRENDDISNLQASLGNLAQNLLHRGELKEALSLYKLQERLCRQPEHPEGLQSSLGTQALILRTKGDFDQALALMKEQEDICRRSENLTGLANSLGNQGALLVNSDPEKALALLKEQERICRQTGNLASLAGSLCNQGINLQLRKNLEGAMALFKEQERISRQLGNVAELQSSLGNQANILHAQGDLQGALKLHREAEFEFKRIGNQQGLATCLGNQAVIFHALENTQHALTVAEEAYQIAQTMGNSELGNRIAMILDFIRR